MLSEDDPLSVSLHLGEASSRLAPIAAEVWLHSFAAAADSVPLYFRVVASTRSMYLNESSKALMYVF